MDRLNVGVIFGGRSVEHDVSIVTAHQVMAALAPRHNVVPIYVTREGRWLHSEALNDLAVYRRRAWAEVSDDAFIPPSAGQGGLYLPGGRFKRARTVPLDVVVPAIHGTFGEDGTLQGLLELAAIPYVGSGVPGSAAGMDKVIMKAAFRAAGLPVVPHVLVEAERLEADPGRALDKVESSLDYPVFVKPARLGSSVGIGRAEDRAGLAQALDVACRYDRRILVERSMEGCIEVNCAVLGGAGVEPRPSLCEQPVPWEQFLTFSDKYLRGGKSPASKTSGMAGQERRLPAPISDRLTKMVQDNAVAAFGAVDASGVARIDAFVDEGAEESWVMEINTVPGSFAFYLWEPAGVSFEELVGTLVDIALETHRRREGLLFSFESSMLEAASSGAKAGG
jgi:D-alanine-D-alanine ligase